MVVCVSQEVLKGKIKLKGQNLLDNLRKELLSNEDELNQYLPNQNEDITYISRLQSVQAAVDEQIGILKNIKPNYKVELITFQMM